MSSHVSVLCLLYWLWQSNFYRTEHIVLISRNYRLTYIIITPIVHNMFMFQLNDWHSSDVSYISFKSLSHHTPLQNLRKYFFHPEFLFKIMVLISLLMFKLLSPSLYTIITNNIKNSHLHSAHLELYFHYMSYIQNRNNLIAQYFSDIFKIVSHSHNKNQFLSFQTCNNKSYMVS